MGRRDREVVCFFSATHGTTRNGNSCGISSTILFKWYQYPNWCALEAHSGGRFANREEVDREERLKSESARDPGSRNVRLSFRRYTVLVKDRFTRRSKTERGRMRRPVKDEVVRRDDYTCQYCGQRFEAGELTIDHLIPMAGAGLDEPTNYVTSCEPCNQRKKDMPLAEFARTVNVRVEDLPVHNDPVIDNESLPIELRMLRKRIFDRMRSGELRISGRSAQKKIERTYRREFWQTARGKALEAEFPNLPQIIG